MPGFYLQCEPFLLRFINGPAGDDCPHVHPRNAGLPVLALVLVAARWWRWFPALAGRDALVQDGR